MAIDPITNTIYVTESYFGAVTIVAEQQVQPIPLVTAITPLTGDQTTSRTPTFSFKTTSGYQPTAPTPLAVYFQLDTWQGSWTQATGTSPQFTGQTSALPLGTHVLYAYATDGQDAGINGDGVSGQEVIGQIAAYVFTVMQAATKTTLSSNVNPSGVGETVTFTAILSVVAPGTGTPTGTVSFMDGASMLGTGTLDSNGTATFSTSGLTLGTHAITAEYGGDTNYTASTSPVLAQVVLNATTTVLSPLSAVSYGTPVTFTATVTASGSGEPTGTMAFLDGTSTLGTGALNGNGVASYTTSTLTVGTHSISAAYDGDVNFASSTSAVLSQVITAPIFTLSSNPSSVTVEAGTSASYGILVTGPSNSVAAVSLSCTAGLPSGASCGFTPQSVVPNTPAGSATLVIRTTAHSAFLPAPYIRGQRGRLLAWLLLFAIVLAFLGMAVPKRRPRLSFALLVILLGLILWPIGCGSGGTDTGTGTPTGKYIVTLTGVLGPVQQTTSVTMVVR